MKNKMYFLYNCKIHIQITGVGVTDVSLGICDKSPCINSNESKCTQNHRLLFTEEISHDHYVELFRENGSL